MPAATPLAGKAAAAAAAGPKGAPPPPRGGAAEITKAVDANAAKNAAAKKAAANDTGIPGISHVPAVRKTLNELQSRTRNSKSKAAAAAAASSSGGGGANDVLAEFVKGSEFHKKIAHDVATRAAELDSWSAQVNGCKFSSMAACVAFVENIQSKLDTLCDIGVLKLYGKWPGKKWNDLFEFAMRHK
jgi:hypothetical protein